MKVIREYYEEALIKEQNDEENILERKKKVKQWLKEKIHQSKKHIKVRIKARLTLEETQKEKELKAKENYRKWLKDKIIKENEERLIRKELYKKKKKIEQRENERKIELKLQSDQAYQEWLHKKSKSNSKMNTPRLGSSRRSHTIPRKPLKNVISQNEMKQKLKIKDTKYSSNCPLITRPTIKCEESSSMSFLSESF